jgi:mannose-6-phosphate isomerase-like protein (cupin superfamily)
MGHGGHAAGEGDRHRAQLRPRRDGDRLVVHQGPLRWHHHVDEMAHILAGEVYITDESGAERRLGPGDTVFFPAGSIMLWRVTADVRKIAVCRVTVPRLVGFGLRAWSKLRRIAAEILGLEGEHAPDSGLVSPNTVSASRAQSIG